MPNPGLRLKEPANAGYVYNPPQTPPFEKEGLVVALGATLLTQEGHKGLKGQKRQKGSCGLEIVGLSWKILHCHYFYLTLYWCVVRLFEDTHHFNSKFYAL